MSGVRAPISPESAPQVVALSVTSAQSAAFGSSTKAVRLVSTASCFVSFGANPTAHTDGSSIYLPANTPQVFGVVAGQKVAGIVASSTANLYVSEALSV